MIEIEGVSFSYRAGEADAVPALRDVDVTIRPGEMVAVIGPNGSGKSTLLKLLAALLYPTSGRIRVDGISTGHDTRWAVRERVSVVFQDPDNQLVANRVVDDVAFGPENLGLPREEIARRVDSALGGLGLQDVRERLIAELSAGQRQRVAIAGALAMQPRVLVLDEPTSYLPAPAASRLLGTLRDIRDRLGMTVVHITHIMGEAAIFDRLIVMDAGRVALDGEPRQVFGHVDALRRIGLDVPVAVSLAERLRARGVPLPEGTVTEADFVDALTKILWRRASKLAGS